MGLIMLPLDLTAIMTIERNIKRLSKTEFPMKTSMGSKLMPTELAFQAMILAINLKNLTKQ